MAIFMIANLMRIKKFVYVWVFARISRHVGNWYEVIIPTKNNNIQFGVYLFYNYKENVLHFNYFGYLVMRCQQIIL